MSDLDWARCYGFWDAIVLYCGLRSLRWLYRYWKEHLRESTYDDATTDESLDCEAGLVDTRGKVADIIASRIAPYVGKINGVTQAGMIAEDIVEQIWTYLRTHHRTDTIPTIKGMTQLYEEGSDEN